MVLVFAVLIQEKEAIETRQEYYEELKQLLTQISSGMTDVMTAGVDGDNKAARAKLHSIQDLVESVSEEIKEASDKDMDTEGVDKQLMAILKLFDSLGRDVRFRPQLISIETQTVLAHSCVSWIADTQSIIEDPEKARVSLDYDNERERLATEFQARFPKFRGHRILVKRRGNSTDFELTDGPPEELDVGEVPPRDALEPHMRKFLVWELRKIPDHMRFDIYIGRGGKRKVITNRVVKRDG